MKNYFFFILLINYYAIVTYILILSIKKTVKKVFCLLYLMGLIII